MEPIRRIGPPTFDRNGVRDERVAVRFKLNREPDTTWMGLFKAHAASSALGGANAVFRGSEVWIEMARPSGVPELATAVDCFIECANLKLRSLPGRAPERRSGLSPLRPRVRGSV
jgi:hypothetical protein